MAMFTFTTNPPKCICQEALFPLANPGPDLFDQIAKELAQEVTKPQMLVEKRRGGERRWEVINEKEANKPAQVRRFYDELCMWEQKAKDTETFGKLLPLIKMMNAKVAYARGRELVDDKFVTWFSICLAQVKDASETGLTTFRNFRTLFEAFLGFYKQVRPN
jgi:CRISPR-associated protein Csm2